MSEVNKQFVKIQIRRGLESELASSNVILASGEPVYAIDSKILKIGEGTKTWSQLTSYSFQTGSFANSVHTHDISGIIDLQSVLDSKQPSGNIPISDISGLQDQLDAKQVAGDYSVNGHAHTSSEINDFTDSVNALIPVSNIVAGDNISITQDGTIFTINGSGGGSNFVPNSEIYDSSINYFGRIDYAENKKIQNISTSGSDLILIKGTGWPPSGENVSNEVLCRLNINHPDGTNVSWNILSEWYNEPTNPLPSGSHLVSLRTIKVPDQDNFIIGTYLGSKTTPTTSNIDIDFSSNLISYWNFDSNIDNAFSGYHLLSNDTPSFASGIIVDGIETNTVQYYYDNNAVFNPVDTLSSITANVWMKTKTTQVSSQGIGRPHLLSTMPEAPPYAGWMLGWSHMSFGSALYANVRSDSGDSVVMVANSSLHDLQWHMVTLVMDIDNSISQLWVDGIKQDEQAVNFTIGGQAGNFTVGHREGLNSRFNGIVDELSIFNKALTELEISVLYNTGFGKTIL